MTSNAHLIFLAMATMAVAGVWAFVPRCPECNWLLSVPDRLDPSLRHCRRCLAIFRKEER